MDVITRVRPESKSFDVEHRSPRTDETSVYNLLVLVRRSPEGSTWARAANLPIRDVQQSTVREALQAVVEQARSLIRECLAKDAQIPWIDPPSLPEDSESRFMVPLHM